MSPETGQVPYGRRPHAPAAAATSVLATRQTAPAPAAVHGPCTITQEAAQEARAAEHPRRAHARGAQAADHPNRRVRAVAPVHRVKAPRALAARREAAAVPRAEAAEAILRHLAARREAAAARRPRAAVALRVEAAAVRQAVAAVVPGK